MEPCRGNASAAGIEQPELHFQVSEVDLIFDADGTGLSPFWQRQRAQKQAELLAVEGPASLKQLEVSLCRSHGS